MKIRGTATERLADVIQTLLFVRKTGVLTVQRDGPGDFFEQGTIVFRDGQVVDAALGRLRGADAFKKLSTWTACSFLFQTEAFPQNLPTSGMPSRTQQFQYAMPDFHALGLSRAHRQLFLLVDGKRPVQVLTRLMGRDMQEVIGLLADLESIGLIHQ